MPIFGTSSMKSTFSTDVVLGQKYRDKHTGFEGHAISVHFYEHACERVALKGLNGQGEIVEYFFDALELEDVETRETPKAEKTGGPHDRAVPPRR